MDFHKNSDRQKADDRLSSGFTSSTYSNLILPVLPSVWKFCRVEKGTKKPIGFEWQKHPFTAEEIRCWVEQDQGNYGVIWGGISIGLDVDGTAANQKLQEIASGKPIPPTVAWTSGLPDRFHLAFNLTAEQQSLLSKMAQKANPNSPKGRWVIGCGNNSGKLEQLEFRWSNHQSVLPPSLHPSGRHYNWLPGQSPAEQSVGIIPDWLFTCLLELVDPKEGNSPPRSLPTKSIKFNSTIPLEQLLRREDRVWIGQGVPEGGRNTTGAALARNLIGTANYLNHQDIPFEGDPKVLFELFCDRCQPPIDKQEQEQIWKSAERSNAQATLSPEAIENCIAAWEQRASEKSTSQKLDSQLLEVLSDDTLGEEDRQEILTEIVDLIKSQSEFFNIKTLVDEPLGEALSLLAKQLNIPEIVFVGFLLPIAASLLKVGISIEIDPLTHFLAPPILWVGVVGETGSTKSLPYRMLMNPLEKIQAESEQKYQVLYQSYQADLDEWDKTPKNDRSPRPTPPKRRDYFFQDTTIEALVDAIATHPDRGSVEAFDELAGWFNGLNQYRNGKGSDRQKWLSAYDGGSIKINRKSSPPIYLDHTSISLLGTIQPQVLRKLMGNSDDADGLFARFWWIVMPLTKIPPPGTGPHCDLQELLYGIYKKLNDFPQRTYRLESEGRKLWRDWHIFCEDSKIEEFHPALRAIYPKTKERAARIALILHCLNAACGAHLPSEVIPAKTVKAAIALMHWSVQQAQSIYAEIGASNHDESARIAKFLVRFKGQSNISARAVTRWYSRKPQLSAEEAQAFMRQLESLNLVVGNGKTGKNYKISVPSRPKRPDKSNELPDTTAFAETDNSPDALLTSPDNLTAEKTPLATPVSISQETVSPDVSRSKPSQDQGSEGFVRTDPLLGEQQWRKGDRFRYIGDRYPTYQNQPLILDKIDSYGATLTLPNGRLTTHLDFKDLQFIGAS